MISNFKSYGTVDENFVLAECQRSSFHVQQTVGSIMIIIVQVSFSGSYYNRFDRHKKGYGKDNRSLLRPAIKTRVIRR